MKKNNEKYVLRKLINDKGIRATIYYDVVYDSKSEKDSFEIIYKADELWKIPCVFALNLFNEQFKKVHKGRLEIAINRIDWFPVDTTMVVVFYSILKGLEDSLNYKLPNFLINFDENHISFPVW